MADNTLTLKIDNETALPLLEKMGRDIIMPIVDGAGKSAYAIAVSHGYIGTESEWLESLRGPKGVQGNDGPEGPRGPRGEQGQQGEAGSAEQAAALLKSKNIYLENAHVDTVLTKVIEKLLENGYIADATFRQLEYTQPRTGQEYIDLTGEPHFKVAVNGGEKREFETDNMRVPIAPFGQDDIHVSYFDLADREVGSIAIKGLETATADETFTDTTGAKFEKYGRKLVLRLATYNGNSFNWLGKWNKSDIETLEIISDAKKKIVDDSTKGYKYDGITFIIKKPNNVAFSTKFGQGTVTVNTMERTISVTLDSSNIEYADGVYNKSGVAASDEL